MADSAFNSVKDVKSTSDEQNHGGSKDPDYVLQEYGDIHERNKGGRPKKPTGKDRIKK